MDDLDSRVAALKAGVAEAGKSQARAEQAHAVALDRAEQARAALRGEFGVETVQEAAVLLERLEKELEAEASSVEEQLRKAGAL